ncbi:type II toxin-antitoxin system HicA family toxin [Uniformispora flossi]|uniref:type II toxin-antitoxin system HicA family toxin n=1 Tax=Uniformispora flossi TaxID=3390723 RepID=UPI003C2E5574
MCRTFGFEHVATKGSHAEVRNGDRIAIIPLHTPLAVGTLRSVLRQAAIEPDRFVAAL